MPSSEEIRSDCINKGQCNKCHLKTTELLYFESPDNFVVAASLNVHLASAKNPLQCGFISETHGIQHVEAFMWALDMINNHPKILPGVQLGAIILDTCSSHQKAARDVSNFLSNSLLAADDHMKLPSADSVVGFIVDGNNYYSLQSLILFYQNLLDLLLHH